MALSARSGGVGASEGKARSAVVEGSGIPTDGSVAGGAVGSGEGRARSRVSGIVRLLPGGEVAAGIAAIVGLDGEIVIAADVALRASSDFAGGGHLVRVLQREAGGAVIEFAIGPSGDGVASGAGSRSCREIRSDVIGNVATKRLGFIPVGLMATHAIG